MCVVRQFDSAPRIPYRLCPTGGFTRISAKVEILLYIHCCRFPSLPAIESPSVYETFAKPDECLWAIHADLPKEILFDCRTIALCDLNRFGIISLYVRMKCQFIRPTFAPSLWYCNNLIHTDNWIYTHRANIGSTVFRLIHTLRRLGNPAVQ